jgi:anti-sigma factor RsiW
MNDHPTESMSAYLDEELDKEERMRIDRHLLQCEICRGLLADLMDMRSQVADFYGHLEAPPDLELKVLASLERKAAATTIHASSVAVPLVGLAALAVLACLYGATFFKLFSIVLQFVLTAAYVISNVASSIPGVWGSVLVLSAGIFVVSGLSLRRILRSAAH